VELQTSNFVGRLTVASASPHTANYSERAWLSHVIDVNHNVIYKQ